MISRQYDSLRSMKNFQFTWKSFWFDISRNVTFFRNCIDIKIEGSLPAIDDNTNNFLMSLSALNVINEHEIRLIRGLCAKVALPQWSTISRSLLQSYIYLPKLCMYANVAILTAYKECPEFNLTGRTSNFNSAFFELYGE